VVLDKKEHAMNPDPNRDASATRKLQRYNSQPPVARANPWIHVLHATAASTITPGSATKKTPKSSPI